MNDSKVEVFLQSRAPQNESATLFDVLGVSEYLTRQESAPPVRESNKNEV